MAVTLSKPVFYELEIKKSRFLAWVEPIKTIDEAKARIVEIRADYPDARHVCVAYYVAGASGLSDDGEPSGTAAKPMFNVLNHKQLVDVLAVVVRYFGGIKLGAGGLVRAYGSAVSKALEQAELMPVVAQCRVDLSFDFAIESQLRHTLSLHGLLLQDIDYQQRVSAHVLIDEPQLERVLADLQNMSPGTDQLSVCMASNSSPE